MPAAFQSKHIVPFDMLDALHMVHNAAFLLLFERARFALWEHLGVSLTAAEFDWPYYVARNEVNYRAPILSAQTVTVSAGIAQFGRTSLTFLHDVWDKDGTLAADGKTVLVRVEMGTGRPLPWSDKTRALLAPFDISTPSA